MSLISANIRSGGCAISAVRLTSLIGRIVPEMTQTKAEPKLIAENRKARFDYFIEDRYEAGMVLQGWEVKSMRAGKAQLTESYAYVKNGEAFLYGAHIAPLNDHVDPCHRRPHPYPQTAAESRRTGAAGKCRGAQGYTLVPLQMYWKAGRAKLQIGVAKGKKQHDKRATEKDRDWQRDKARILRTR